MKMSFEGGTSRFLRFLSASLLLSAATVPAGAEPVPVTATFSILGDMVKQIGGERVAVTTLVGADGDAHVFKPSPADARAVARSKIVVLNGLGFEGWMERLLEAAESEADLITATDGVDAIEYGEKEEHHDDSHKDEQGHAKSGHDDEEKSAAKAEHGHKEGEHKDDKREEHAHHEHDHGTYDPHAWQDLANAEIYAQNIARGLSRVDPDNAAHYKRRLDTYLGEIAALDAQIRSAMSQLPTGRRTIITSHDAFQYFGRAYGLTFLAPQGLSTESDASAEDVANLIRQIRKQKITAVFVENLGDPRLVKRIADETGAVVGGTLYPGALSPSDGPAPTYLDMLRTNANVLRAALED